MLPRSNTRGGRRRRRLGANTFGRVRSAPRGPLLAALKLGADQDEAPARGGKDAGFSCSVLHLARFCLPARRLIVFRPPDKRKLLLAVSNPGRGQINPELYARVSLESGMKKSNPTKRILSTGALAVVLFAFHSSAPATTFTVLVGGDAPVFTPASKSIHPGDTVNWIWGSAGISHSVTSGTGGTPDGLFDSGIHKDPFTFSFTFPNPGAFNLLLPATLVDGNGRNGRRYGGRLPNSNTYPSSTTQHLHPDGRADGRSSAHRRLHHWWQ